MKILVFKIGALGDTLMVTPFLRQLRKTYPKATIDFLVGKGASVILEGNKSVDTIISFDENIFFKKKLFSWLKLVFSIRRRRYDAIFILDKHKAFNLTAWFFGIHERIGFDRNGEGVLLTHKVAYGSLRHEAEYYLDLLKAFGKKPNYSSLQYDCITKKPKLALPKEYIVVANSGGNNVGEQSLVRRMPESLFKDIVSQLDSVVFVGSSSEKEQYTSYKGVNLCGKLNLAESAYVLAHAKTVITTDSGIMHLAAAVNKNVICVFGPTHPERKAPKFAKVVWKDAKIYDDAYELYGTKPEQEFMTTITAADILRLLP